jgi:hypothetical protein
VRMGTPRGSLTRRTQVCCHRERHGCLVHVDEAGVLRAAADPRRDSYALAW